MEKIEFKEGNLLAELSRFEVIDKFKHLFDEGYYISAETKKLTPPPQPHGLLVNHSWVHVRDEMGPLACLHYKAIFTACDFVPTHCLNCWKVVAIPKTVKELIESYKLIVRLGYSSKCGIEERPYVDRNFGCYFYTRSKEEGLARKEEVKKEFAKISSGIKVNLKRFCTEFEMKLCPGKSSSYVQPPDAKEWERRFYEYVDVDKMIPKDTEQPPILIKYIIRRWLIWANDRSDPTAKPYNNGESFFARSQTYNQ